MKQYVSLIIFILVFFITACNGDNSVSVIDNEADATQSGETKLSGTAAIGAGLRGHSLDLLELDPSGISQPKLINTETLDENSKFEVSIPNETDTSEKVYLVQVRELEAPDVVVIESIIFGQDIGKSIKITPYTDLIAKSILNNDSLSDLASIRDEYDNVASGVVSVLKPVSEALGIDLEADSLLFGDFLVESSGHDELIEAVAFNCNESSCSIDFASDAVEQAVVAKGIPTEFTVDDTIAEQLNQVASGLNDLKETPPANFDFTASIKDAGPIVVLFSYDGSWGQPGDSWAGYNGKIKLINLSDGPLDVANKSLSMISESLDMTGAWGAALQKKVLKSGKTKYTFKFHKYSQPLQPDEYRVIGFNGKGAPTEVNDLIRCRYKGESCIIKYGDNLSDFVSDSSFVVDIDSVQVIEDGDITDDVNTEGTSQDRVPADVAVSATVVDIILEKAGDPWSTGFNGVIKFTSPVSTSSWSLTFRKPENVSDISMWSHGGGLNEDQSFIDISNKSWNGALSPDVVNTVGTSVTGKSTYGEVSSDGCVLTLDGVDYSCNVIANEEATSAEDLSVAIDVGTELPEIIEDNGTLDNETDDDVTVTAVVDNTPTGIHSAVVKGSGLTQSKTPTTMTFTAPSDFKNKVVAGYLSDWSVYGRGFDVERLLTPEGTFPYNKLVFAFLGICGDKGSLGGKIAAQCQEQGKKEYEAVFLDPWADFGLGVSPRQKGLPWDASKGVIEQIQYIKKQVPSINISASIGGWTMSEPFHRMASNPESIQTFVNSLKELQEKYGFTGFDIDWEFPGHGGASGKFTQNDGQYFKDLVCAVKSGLGDNIEVSSAVGATTTFINHIGSHYKTIYDQGCLDYIYMMNYDFFGAWDEKIGHQTSIMPSTSLSGDRTTDIDMRWSVNAAIQAFEQAGFKRDRLLMGVANYGRGFKSLDLTMNDQGALGGSKTSKTPSVGTFENGVMEGYDLWRNVAGDDLYGRGDFELFSDFEAHADAYFNKVTGDYISIDTPRTAYTKAKLADILGLAGTFVWTVEQDDGRIVTAMQDGLGINGTVPSERATAYTTCGIPFKDTENNLCAELYNGLNTFASGSGAESSIAAVLDAAVNIPSPGQTVRVIDGNADSGSAGTYVIYRSELNAHQASAQSGYSENINNTKAMLRTRENDVVEAVSPLNANNPENVKRVEQIFTQSDWDELFSHAAPEYSYPKFLQGVAKYPALCDTYTDGRDSDAICRKSLVTMFAHFVQETGKNSEYEGETWKQGLYFSREMNFTETSLNAYNGNCDDPNDFSSTAFPCDKFASGDYKSYFGRGAKQLSYNYNYGPLSKSIYGDVSVLLNNPEKVADTWLNIASAIFFYVYPQPPKPSMLSVIDGSWTPNQADIDAGITSGFGATIHIINGGLECGAGKQSHPGPANRISYYRKFADYFSMDIPVGEELGCENMKPFNSSGTGAVPIYWEQDWQNAYKCKLVNYQTAYTTFDDNGYENCVKAIYPEVVIVEDVDTPVVNDDSDTDSTDDNTSSPSNPADCTSGYCTAVASINGKNVSEVITNANASSVTRTSSLKFGGYVSDWAQYGRKFALADVGATAYTELVYSFFGICGDQGTFVSDKANPNSTTADKIEANCTALNKQEGEIVSLDFWGSFQNSSRFDPGHPWNDIYNRIDATNWNALNADNTRGLVGELVNLKQQNPSLDISLSIGGWTLSEPFHRVAADTTLTNNFANSVLEIVDKFKVNGEPLFTTIDIDWEFPGHGGDCNASGCYTPDDGTNFVTLLQAVRDVLDSNGYSQVKLSSAVGATEKYINFIGASNYQALGGSNGLLDKIFLMSYDYWGSWDTVLGHQTNLFGDSVDPSSVDSNGDPVATNSAENAINLLVNMGVEKSRMMLGIANYSRGKQASTIVTDGEPFSATGVSDAVLFGTWEPTVLEGYDLFANVAGPDMKGVNNFKLFTDVDNNADYYYNPVSGVYHSIDTPRTAALKTKYAVNNGLRGVFVWTVEQDHKGLIADTVNHTLGHTISENGAYRVAEIESLSLTCGDNVSVSECTNLNSAAGNMGVVDPNFIPPAIPSNGGMSGTNNYPSDSICYGVMIWSVSESWSNYLTSTDRYHNDNLYRIITGAEAFGQNEPGTTVGNQGWTLIGSCI
ncbi:putative endochitinase domain protein [Photobacterium leiognathi lrivu.4.1]|uniref:chitinase n=1 Tax=Photobacterium leiognathi lrivu.4.1 TaxID=1248232 RepID=V5FA48_PHOLE|nr:glycosyl hydrolase family 18 protein [Photobacterium leiognathi]GAD32599.1 putative endochitinase domain protein [Photobacterium leiognathi lrivu.4.1]